MLGYFDFFSRSKLHTIRECPLVCTYVNASILTHTHTWIGSDPDFPHKKKTFTFSINTRLRAYAQTVMFPLQTCSPTLAIYEYFSIIHGAQFLFATKEPKNPRIIHRISI